MRFLGYGKIKRDNHNDCPFSFDLKILLYTKDEVHGFLRLPRCAYDKFLVTL